MFGLKKDDKKLDVKSLNELITVSKNVINIIFILSVVTLIFVISKIIIDTEMFKKILGLISIISPLFIGIAVAWILDPLVNRLVKRKISRKVATFIVFMLFLACLIISFSLIIPTLVDQLREFVVLAPKIIDNAKSWADNFFGNLNNLYDYDFNSIKDGIYSSVVSFSDKLTVDAPAFTINFVSNILSGGLTIIIGLFIGFYMLFDFNNVRKTLLSFLPKKIHNDTIILTDKLNKTLKNYVQGTIFVTIILFTVQTIGFTISGLKAPAVFGLICAVTNIIPYVGPYIGGIPAILVGFTISPLVGTLTLASVIISQFIESYILTPIVLSKTMKLHPVTIIIGLLIFGHFLGLIGMLLSTPIVSCLKIIAAFIDEKFKILDKINS